MNGKELTDILSVILKERGISVEEQCKAIGVTQSSYSQWKKGMTPKENRLRDIEKYLNIRLSDYEKSDDIAELREMLRERQDLRILLSSARDVPPSSVYALVSQIEKMKEDANDLS